MDIKLVATDMDGTFLRQKHTYNADGQLIDLTMDYDKPMFEQVLQKLKDKGGHFVVASGNQYYQLKSFFPGLDHEITYAAENGAYIIDKGEEVFSANIEKETRQEILAILKEFSGVKICICGKNNAYILSGDQEFKNLMQLFYRRLKEVNHFEDINDQILKFSLIVANEKLVPEVIEKLNKKVGHIIQVVDSGMGCIDLNMHGVNKGFAIKLLSERWNVDPSQCVAFGDSGNDIEMIQFVTYGYAMENAKPTLKQLAYAICESNNQQGVLKTLLEIL